MVLRLAYLPVTNAVAALRLLPMRDHEKDTAILVLRHQITVLETAVRRSTGPELLDRTPIWNERHLRHALHEFEQHYNTYRLHQALNQATPLRENCEPITDLGRIARVDIRRRDRLAGVIHEYRLAA